MNTAAAAHHDALCHILQSIAQGAYIIQLPQFNLTMMVVIRDFIRISKKWVFPWRIHDFFT